MAIRLKNWLFPLMLRPDLLEIPEQAMRAFERQSGLQVVVHELVPGLGPYVEPERFKHRSPACLAVKARHNWACVDFDVTRLRPTLRDTPEGRYHRCHAGLVEWVVPVFLRQRLAWVLFAGQARTAGEFGHLRHDIRSTADDKMAAPALPVVDEARAQAVLESLRQLRSRLVEWHAQMTAMAKHTRAGGDASLADMTDRKRLILDFVHGHHEGEARLADLAKVLNLSESRTSHLVKTLCGCGYVQLLTECRLRAAASLLRMTSLPITEVCLNSGFRDLAHFHRCFRKRFEVTPRRYRVLARL